MPAPKDPIKREEWIQNLSKSHKGKPSHLKGKTRDEAANKKISATLQGRHPTPEHREHHLAAMQERWANMSPEQAERFRTARVGQTNSEEHNHKIGKANEGRPMCEITKVALHTPQARMKRSVSRKASFDALSPDEQARQIQRFIRSGGSKNRDTSLEVFVAAQLDRMGIAYEQQKHIGRYVVDFLISEQPIILEVNGCFWHCCEQCDIKEEYHPGKREHDRKRIEALEARGYTVYVLWEHDLQPLMKEMGLG